MKTARPTFAFLIAMVALADRALAQTPSPQLTTAPQAAAAPRPAPPTRDPNTPGYVTAKELPDGTVPPPDTEGNFVIGPTHNPAPEASLQAVPQGRLCSLTMSSAD